MAKELVDAFSSQQGKGLCSSFSKRYNVSLLTAGYISLRIPWDNTVQVWDAATGNLAIDYQGHSDTVLSVAWSPDGTKIASGSQDKTVRVWEA